MSIYDSTKDDWMAIDGIEEVTFVPKNRAADSVSGVKALRRSLAEEETHFAAGVGYTAPDLVWHLWDSTISGSERPRQQDQIIDADGGVWNVRSVRLLTFGTRWRCTCHKLP